MDEEGGKKVMANLNGVMLRGGPKPLAIQQYVSSFCLIHYAVYRDVWLIKSAKCSIFEIPYCQQFTNNFTRPNIR